MITKTLSGFLKFLIILSVCFSPIFVFAATSSVGIVENKNFNFPWENSNFSTTSLGGLVAFFYRYALGIVGVAALIMIIYGGVKYTLSAGSAGGKKEALDIIKNAIFGLVLLLVSYILLNTINPQIVGVSNVDTQIGGLSEQHVEPTILENVVNNADRSIYNETSATKGKCPDYSKASPSFDVAQSQFQKDIESYAKAHNGKLNNVYVLFRKTNDKNSGQQCRELSVIDKKTAKKIARTTSVNVGAGDPNGISKLTTMRSGDRITPDGTFTLSAPIINLKAGVISNQYNVCMGPAFILYESNGRGLHGGGSGYDGSLGLTAGCIKLYNRDVYTLAKYLVAGTELRILSGCSK